MVNVDNDTLNAMDHANGGVVVIAASDRGGHLAVYAVGDLGEGGDIAGKSLVDHGSGHVTIAAGLDLYGLAQFVGGEF
jgi:hypothetical protein